MIDLEGLTGRAVPIVLAPITTSFAAGMFALLGAREDAVTLLLDLIAGRARPRGGIVRVLGGNPADAEIRRRIAHVPLEAALPEAIRVSEAFALAAEIRGAEKGGETARDPKARLDTLGLGTLADRKVKSLTADEARGVALAEAVTSNAKVLLVEEPFASIDPRAAAVLGGVLRARARDGVCVIFSTASVRDALALSDEVLTFDRGTLIRRAPSTDPLATAGPRGAALRAIVSDVKRFLGALALEDAGGAGDATDAFRVEVVQVERGAVVVRGRDAIALASAIASAVTRSGVTLEALVADVAPLPELRAAIAGDAAGAYRAAFDRAKAAVIPPIATPGSPAAQSAKPEGEMA